MKIAIPTYNRSNKFETILFLKKNNVPIENIYIFLANEEEKKKYISVYGDKYNWIVGVIGIGAQRNFINEYFEENEIIISMDDDIKDLIHKDNKPFIEWTKECFDYLRDNNVGLISFCPSTNPYFFTEKIKLESHKSWKCGNYLAVGVIHIYRNHKDLTMDFGSIAEDYERSIMYYKKYGSNARYFDILIETKYWATGGCDEERTIYTYIRNVHNFLYRHPKYVSFNTKYIRNITKSHKLPNIISHRTPKDNVDIIKLPKIERKELCNLYELLNNIEGNYETYPSICEEVMRIGDIFCPFKIKNIIITKNEIYVFSGECMLVSFGDFTGSQLIINHKKYDNDYTYAFSSQLNHSNTNDLVGTKYSIYFIKKIPL